MAQASLINMTQLFTSKIEFQIHPEMNHYNNLNVKVNASEAEIKKACFKLALLYHPDKVSINITLNRCIG